MGRNQQSVLRSGSRDDLLFHYTSRGIALEYVVTPMWIRLGRYTKTNDPRETKQWVRHNFVVSPRRAVPRDKSRTHVVRAFDEIAPFSDRLRLLCLTRDSEDPINDAPEVRGYGLSRMWAQYGGNHTGVCLVFHRSRPEKSIVSAIGDKNRLLHGNVDYGILRDEYEHDGGGRAYELIAGPNTEQDFMRHTIENQRELLFKKSSDWKGEGEYRWVYIAEPGEGDINVPIDKCLVAIVVGIEFPPVYLPVVHTPCSRCGVQVFLMRQYRDHMDEPEELDMRMHKPR